NDASLSREPTRLVITSPTVVRFIVMIPFLLGRWCEPVAPRGAGKTISHPAARRRDRPVEALAGGPPWVRNAAARPGRTNGGLAGPFCPGEAALRARQDEHEEVRARVRSSRRGRVGARWWPRHNTVITVPDGLI